MYICNLEPIGDLSLGFTFSKRGNKDEMAKQINPDKVQILTLRRPQKKSWFVLMLICFFKWEFLSIFVAFSKNLNYMNSSDIS